MIQLVALILGVVAFFGIGSVRVALGDLAEIEAENAAQRAAEAAAARAYDLLTTSNPSDTQVTIEAQAEAIDVAGANATRGVVQSVTIFRTSSAADLVDITVTIVVDYGGLAGPLEFTRTGAAGVRRR